LQSVLSHPNGRTDLSRRRKSLLRRELWRPLQFRAPDLAIDSVLFGRTRARLDRQPPGHARFAGPGFHVQHFDRDRRCLRNRRSLEDRHRNSLRASLEWWPNRSKSEFESNRSANWPVVFVLSESAGRKHSRHQAIFVRPARRVSGIELRAAQIFGRDPVARKQFLSAAVAGRKRSGAQTNHSLRFARA